MTKGFMPLRRPDRLGLLHPAGSCCAGHARKPQERQNVQADVGLPVLLSHRVMTTWEPW